MPAPPSPHSGPDHAPTIKLRRARDIRLRLGRTPCQQRPRACCHRARVRTCVARSSDCRLSTSLGPDIGRAKCSLDPEQSRHASHTVGYVAPLPGGLKEIPLRRAEIPGRARHQGLQPSTQFMLIPECPGDAPDAAHGLLLKFASCSDQVAPFAARRKKHRLRSIISFLEPGQSPASRRSSKRSSIASHLASWDISMYSSALCPCAMRPGPQTTAGMPKYS